MRRIMKLGALALGLLVPLGAAMCAQAAELVLFTIAEQGKFAAGVFTFAATGPLCPSGTYVYTNTGPIQLLGGTGAYTGLGGHGVDNGVGNVEDTGLDQIAGFVVRGEW